MTLEARTVIFDGHNFMHRARSGFQLGDHAIVFNFVRNLRAAVELLKPTRVLFTLEGHPKKRYALQPDYKANRKILLPSDGSEPDAQTLKKVKDMQDFFRQKDIIVELLSKHFPISVIRHPDHECDDVIYNLIKKSSKAVPWTVVSNDSDFTQLLDQFNHVTVYNPMMKENFVKTDYDYVSWKALRGDGSDNIPSVEGITDKYAESLVNDPDALMKLFEDTDKAKQFEKNYEMIKFIDWSDEEAMEMTSSAPVRDWDAVAGKFREWQFNSLLKEKTFEKFTSTFDHLWVPGD